MLGEDWVGGEGGMSAADIFVYSGEQFTKKRWGNGFLPRPCSLICKTKLLGCIFLTAADSSESSIRGIWEYPASSFPEAESALPLPSGNMLRLNFQPTAWQDRQWHVTPLHFLPTVETDSWTYLTPWWGKINKKILIWLKTKIRKITKLYFPQTPWQAYFSTDLARCRCVRLPNVIACVQWDRCDNICPVG